MENIAERDEGIGYFAREHIHGIEKLLRSELLNDIPTEDKLKNIETIFKKLYRMSVEDGTCAECPEIEILSFSDIVPAYKNFISNMMEANSNSEKSLGPLDDLVADIIKKKTLEVIGPGMARVVKEIVLLSSKVSEEEKSRYFLVPPSANLGEGFISRRSSGEDPKSAEELLERFTERSERARARASEYLKEAREQREGESNESFVDRVIAEELRALDEREGGKGGASGGRN